MATTETVPNRSILRAQEVCELLQLQPYVLRSWEAEFPEMGVSKTADGPRLYRRTDVELVGKLKHLLFVDGLTLAGARKQLVLDGAAAAVPDAEEITDADVAALVDKQARKGLKDIRVGLDWILDLLGGAGGHGRSRGRITASRGRSASRRAAKPVKSKSKPAPKAKARAAASKPKRTVGRKKR